MHHQFLSCPHLMSDDALRDILKDRCIELPEFKPMDKTELIEIFKRVALPLPQRVYNGARSLGKKMESLRLSRNISVADYDGNINYNIGVIEQCDNHKEMSECAMKSNCNRLKSPINDTKVIVQRRIRVSNTDKSETAVTDSYDMKRKYEAPSPTDPKKRQKITWP